MPHVTNVATSHHSALPPYPLALLLKTMPNALHGMMIAHVFNLMIGPQAITTRARELHGRRIGIAITDTGNRWCFLIANGRLYSTNDALERCEVSIRGTLAVFLRLATRTEDPDTLFFNRQLIIEGATETGLAVKNFLDSLDYDWEGRLSTLLGPAPTKRIADIVARSGAPRQVHLMLARILGQTS